MPPYLTQQDFNFSGNLLQLWEVLIFPIYLLIIYFVSIRIRKSLYTDKTTSKYFIPGLTLKIVGAIFITLIYNLYYGGGDTNAYFKDGFVLTKILLNDPLLFIRLILVDEIKSASPNLVPILSYFRFSNASNTWIVVKFSAIIQLFCFNSFLSAAIIFAFISFFPIWKIYLKFLSIERELKKEFAISFLFIPSVVIWGSGLFKDTVTLALLCLLFCSLYDFFIKKENILINAIIIFISSYLIIVIKTYIFLAFSGSFLLWLGILYIKNIKNPVIKIIARPIILIISIAAGYYILLQVGGSFKLYSIENILRTSEITRDYLHYVSEKVEGSTYSLGEIDSSVPGLLKKLPAAINVTLFRPYLWESKKAIILLSALESSWFIYLTIITLLNVGLLKALGIIYKKDLVIFCLTFSLFFAFAVGISTFNFGSLVRYKIPCLPFYLSAIFLIKHYGKQKI